MAPSHVLVPLDGSPLASDALDHALETFDCRITVLNVVTPLDSRMSEGSPRAVEGDRVGEAEDRAARLLEAARARIGRADRVDRPVEVVVRTGDPSAEITACVEAHGVDHVVMGGHGGESSEVKRRLLGTVSTAVIGDTSVPVTLVR